MNSTPSESLPKDLVAAHTMIVAERAARGANAARLNAEAAVAKAHTGRQRYLTVEESLL